MFHSVVKCGMISKFQSGFFKDIGENVKLCVNGVNWDEKPKVIEKVNAYNKNLCTHHTWGTHLLEGRGWILIPYSTWHELLLLLISLSVLIIN